MGRVDFRVIPARGNLVEVHLFSGVYPRESLLRRVTLGLYEETALPFLEKLSPPLSGDSGRVDLSDGSLETKKPSEKWD